MGTEEEGILLASLSCQDVSSFYNLLYETLEQDAPNHTRKQGVGDIFIVEGHRDFSLSILGVWSSDGLGGVRLMVGLGDLRGLFQWFHDPMILQRFPPLLGHPGHPLGKTGCRNNCMCWSGSTCERRGKGRVESTFSFVTRTVGFWTHLPPGQITNAHYST